MNLKITKFPALIGMGLSILQENKKWPIGLHGLYVSMCYKMFKQDILCTDLFMKQNSPFVPVKNRLKEGQE